MKTKFLALFAVLISLASVTGCAGLNPSPATPERDYTLFYYYDVQIGIIDSQLVNVAVKNLIIRGSGSFNGSPGIYVNEQTIMPFVNQGPCAGGPNVDPCWVGTIIVPRNGAHEWIIEAALDLTPAKWSEMQTEGGSAHTLYCNVSRDNIPVSILSGDGVSGTTPVQEPGPHLVVCKGMAAAPK